MTGWAPLGGDRAVVLRDGRALVLERDRARLFETTEALDVPPVPDVREGAGLVALHDGRALTLGGRAGDTPLSRCHFFDPTSARWSKAPALTRPRSYVTAVALPDRVLAIAGAAGTVEELVLTEASPQWRVVPKLSIPRPEYWVGAAALTDDSVLISLDDRAERWQLTEDGWLNTPGPRRGRGTPVALDDGGALYVGGTGATQVDRLDGNNRWSPVVELAEARHESGGVQLADGRVLLVGGFGRRTTTEDSSDGGELDLEYRTIGPVRRVEQTVELDDLLLGRPGERFTPHFGKTLFGPRVMRFGEGALISSSRGTFLWFP